MTLPLDQFALVLIFDERQLRPDWILSKRVLDEERFTAMGTNEPRSLRLAVKADKPLDISRCQQCNRDQRQCSKIRLGALALPLRPKSDGPVSKRDPSCHNLTFVLEYV